MGTDRQAVRVWLEIANIGPNPPSHSKQRKGNTLTIVDDITEYLNTYMVFSEPRYPVACALWVLHTWTFGEGFAERPFTTPYFYINSLEPGAGKTLLIDLLQPITLNPERADDMSSSTMFRLIESRSPCLFIDEVDTVWSGAKNEDLRRVINGGYKRSGYIWRTVPGPDGPEPTQFRTFCPKLLAGIDNGHLPDTVATRCLFINLKRVATLDDAGRLVAPDGSSREIYYAFMAEEQCELLQDKIAAFIRDWTADYKRYVPAPIPGMNPRHWEIAMPLIQVAARVGIEAEAREMLKDLFTPPKQDTQEVAALRTIQALFMSLKVDRMHTEDICAGLGEGWSGHRLGARVITPFGIGPSAVMTIGNRTKRGYHLSQFSAAFARYL